MWQNSSGYVKDCSLCSAACLFCVLSTVLFLFVQYTKIKIRSDLLEKAGKPGRNEIKTWNFSLLLFNVLCPHVARESCPLLVTMRNTAFFLL